MATKQALQFHNVDNVAEEFLNRERKVRKGSLSRPDWREATQYVEIQTVAGGIGDFDSILSTSSYTIGGVSYPIGTSVSSIVTAITNTDVASISYNNSSGTFTLTHSDGSTSTTTIGMEDDRTLTTSSLTIDGVTFPAGSTLSSVLTAIIAAEAANGEFRGSVADNTALLAITSPVEGDLAYVTDSNGVSGGSSGIPAIVAYNGSAWIVVQLFNTNDSSITSGTLATATGNRTANFGTNNLVLDNLTDVRINASGEYVQGDGAGSNLPTIDSDAVAFIQTTLNANGRERRMSKLATQILVGASDPVNGTTVSWYVGQIYRNTTTNRLFVSTAKSTDPDSAGTGSTWIELPFKGIVQYTSGQAVIWATGVGITFTVGASGAWVFAIPSGVDILKTNIDFALSDTDTANSNKAYILFDYSGARSFNTSYTNVNYPSSLGVIPDSAGSRSTPANLTVVDHGISAIAGGDGSDLEVTVTSAAVATNNQMIIQFSNF